MDRLMQLLMWWWRRLLLRRLLKRLLLLRLLKHLRLLLLLLLLKLLLLLLKLKLVGRLPVESGKQIVRFELTEPGHNSLMCVRGVDPFLFGEPHAEELVGAACGPESHFDSLLVERCVGFQCFVDG